MRTLLAAIAALAMMAALPAGAQAFGVQVNQAKPANTDAGANSDFLLQLSFTDGTPQSLTLALPPGLVADAQRTRKCALADFEANRCTASNLVGTVNAAVRIFGASVQTPGYLYLVTPQNGEVARLGLQLRPIIGDPINSSAPVEVRADGGLTTTASNLPNSLNGTPFNLESLSINLQGLTTQSSFMRNPTVCTPPVTAVAAVSYAGEGATASGSYTPTSCDKLPFTPELDVRMGGEGQTTPGSGPDATITIEQDPGESGQKTTTVVLPVGIGPNPAVLSRACPADLFAAGRCPASSQVGVATAASPILPKPLFGAVDLVQGSPLPQLGVRLTGPVNQTLLGKVSLTPGGQIATTFDNIPDLPITQFRLAMPGGPDGLLRTSRSLCGFSNPNASGIALSQAGKTLALSTAPEVDGCTQDVERGPSGLKRASVHAKLSGLSATPRLALSVRGKRSARVKRFDVRLPKAVRVGSQRRITRTGGASVRVVNSRTLRVTLPGSGARSARISVRRGLRVADGIRRRTTRARFTIAFAGGGQKYTTRAQLTRRR